MLQWETLKLTPTPGSLINTIVIVIIINFILFALTWVITNFIIFVIVGDDYLDDTMDNDIPDEMLKKLKNLERIQYITIACILILASVSFIKYSRTAYYTIKVQVAINEIDIQDLNNTNTANIIPEDLKNESIKNVEDMFFIKESKYTDKTLYTKSKNRKFIKEDGKIFFIMRMKKTEYDEFSFFCEVKNDIQATAQCDIKSIVEENEKIDEKTELQEFTKKHTETTK